LIAPFESHPERLIVLEWLTGGRRVARVKTYGDVIEEYEWHPETKCADAAGKPCTKQTVGLLHRRRITLDHIVYIGRESNQLEGLRPGCFAQVTASTSNIRIRVATIGGKESSQR
jgi:hypothetical protein